MATQKTSAKSRSSGGLKGKPVMVSLSVEEREHLERIAETEMRTLSATARIFILEGMEKFEESAKR